MYYSYCVFSSCRTKLQNSREFFLSQTPYFKRKPGGTLSQTVWKRHEGLFIKLPCRAVVTLCAESVTLKCFLIHKLPGQSKYTISLQQVVCFWAGKGFLLQNMQVENRQCEVVVHEYTEQGFQISEWKSASDTHSGTNTQYKNN